MTTVALLRTGTMGAGMARNIAAAGLLLRVWNRTRSRAEALADVAHVGDDLSRAVLAQELGLRYVDAPVLRTKQPAESGNGPTAVGGGGYGPGMATWDDVRRSATALPETAEGERRGYLSWAVRTKGFVWERPLRKADLEHLGDAAPEGSVLAARTADVGVKDALVADDPGTYFTTPHFQGYPAVLVRLDVIGEEELDELVVEAWLAVAPKRLARQYLDRG